jgi:hypothetical protein
MLLQSSPAELELDHARCDAMKVVIDVNKTCRAAVYIIIFVITKGDGSPRQDDEAVAADVKLLSVAQLLIP